MDKSYSFIRRNDRGFTATSFEMRVNKLLTRYKTLYDNDILSHGRYEFYFLRDQSTVRTFRVAPLSRALFSAFSARFSALSGNSINLTTVKAGIRRSFPICRQIHPVST